MALICDICKTRPAEARVTFMHQGRPRAVDICREDYQQLQTGNYNFPSLEKLVEVSHSQNPLGAPEQDISQLFSAATGEVFQRAAQVAAGFQVSALEGEHVLMALAENERVQQMFQQFKSKTTDIQGYLEANAQRGNKNLPMLAPSEELKGVVQTAYRVSQEFSQSH